MDSMGMMRDLDQIRERDDARESSKLVLVALGGLATACVLFAIGIMIGRDADAGRAARREDPLARLDALARTYNDAGAATPGSLVPEVDDPAAVLARAGQQIPPATPLPAGSALAPTLGGAGVATPGITPAAIPAPANDPTRPAAAMSATGPAAAATAVPLAALVELNGAVRENVLPTAQLPVAAANQARLSPPSAPASPAAPGADGAFTLQVSSFRTLGAAQVFAQRLRERGHRAFVSNGPGAAGVAWYRVRIGPFATQREAAHYRADFEARERLPTFIVRRDAHERTVRD